MPYLESVCTTTIRTRTIKKVDEKVYRDLQSLVRRQGDARDIHPVQYDDIMWRQLNRVGDDHPN